MHLVGDLASDPIYKDYYNQLSVLDLMQFVCRPNLKQIEVSE